MIIYKKCLNTIKIVTKRNSFNFTLKILIILNIFFNSVYVLDVNVGFVSVIMLRNVIILYTKFKKWIYKNLRNVRTFLKFYYSFFNHLNLQLLKLLLFMKES